MRDGKRFITQAEHKRQVALLKNTFAACLSRIFDRIEEGLFAAGEPISEDQARILVEQAISDVLVDGIASVVTADRPTEEGDAVEGDDDDGRVVF